MTRGAVLLSLALFLYPIVFYLLVEQINLTGLGLLLGLLITARLVVLKHLPAWLRLLSVFAVVMLVTSVHYWQSGAMLKLYPVAINWILLCYGVYTLWRPPSAVERLVRRLKMPVSEAGIGYTRGVTVLWCVFFAVNGGIAAYTALAAPTSIWALYNGVVSYAAAALIFGLEYGYRGIYQRRAELRERSTSS